MKRAKGGMPEMPELLAPAGSYEKLVTAIHYGCDAVYLGGKDFSLRAKAANFDEQAMAEALGYAHAKGVRVYVTVNIFAHNRDLAGLPGYLRQLQEMGVDGVIVADPGVLSLCRIHAPELAVHLSTQANVTNSAAAAFWVAQGVTRLNLARELSLQEIIDIRQLVAAEIEIFVHGAVCISYSGRCMLSNYMTGRDANQGECAHPCRFSYRLLEEKRPDQYFPVEEDERGTYIFNSKDLCLLQKLPLLVAAGANSLKIEGRMKSIFYVGGVVRVYRAALDYLASLPPTVWENPEQIEIPQEFVEELLRTGTRGTTENFLQSPPGAEDMIYDTPRSIQSYEPVAVIRSLGESLGVEVRNTLELGEKVEIMGRGLSLFESKVTAIFSAEGEVRERAHPGTAMILQLSPVPEWLEVNTILRRRKK